MYSAGRDGNINSKSDICLTYGKGNCSCKQEGFYSLHKPLMQSSHMYDENMCCISGLRLSCLALAKYFHLSPSLTLSKVYLYCPSVPTCMLGLDWNCYMQIQYLILMWCTPFGVSLNCIAMLSVTNNSVYCEC